MAVCGLFDKGKTFCLNNLSGSNLPSSKKVNTKGLSFKGVEVDGSTKLILLDTAGSYSPVRVINDMSIVEKEATEMFILDLVFDLADYFICVVNDFTSLDQRYLDKITRSLQNSSRKMFREVIVIHNLKEVESQEVLEHVWKNQVIQIYGSGSTKRTRVASINPITKALEEKHVIWFKTPFSRHVLLASQDSMLGLSLNPWAFSLIRYWLKAVFVPVDQSGSLLSNVIQATQAKLNSYFKTSSFLSLSRTEKELVYRVVIKSTQPNEGLPLRLPQISIDSSGMIVHFSLSHSFFWQDS